jgi:hypothetical protein
MVGTMGGPKHRLEREVVQQNQTGMTTKTRAIILLSGGAFIALLGAILGIAALTQYHAIATVTRQGPCVVTTTAGQVCTEHVTYVAHDGTTHSAIMSGVHPDEVHGPPNHRTLAISYTSGDSSPTTDDMPNAVPLGMLGGGIGFACWAFWLFRRARHEDARHADARALKTSETSSQTPR